VIGKSTLIRAPTLQVQWERGSTSLPRVLFGIDASPAGYLQLLRPGKTHDKAGRCRKRRLADYLCVATDAVR